jgi:transposase
MRKVKEVLRLKYDCNLSERDIARTCQVSRSTIADYLMKAKAAGLGWPEADTLSEAQINEILFPIQRIPQSVPRPLPDCEYIYKELRTYRKFNLTLSQLWIEYKA